MIIIIPIGVDWTPIFKKGYKKPIISYLLDNLNTVNIDYIYSIL